MRVFSKDTSWNFQVVYFERTYVWQTGSTPPPFQAICKFSSEAVFNIGKTPGTLNCKWCGYFAIVFACVLQQNKFSLHVCCNKIIAVGSICSLFSNWTLSATSPQISTSTFCHCQLTVLFSRVFFSFNLRYKYR